MDKDEGREGMWYAVRTMEGEEEAVKRRVGEMAPQESGWECRVLYCIHKKRYLGEWHEERERLLPGYLFFVADGPEPVSRALGRITGYAGLGGGGMEACPVDREEEELLERLAGGTEEIGMSYGVIRDGVLKVKEGALVGLEGAVRKIDRHKRKGYINLSFPGMEKKLVGIGLEVTEKS